ncbi:FAD-binding oxidoreductase [Streptomyces sp. NPDC048362]|uniref:FAD-binding oxidoreductase n=1 Tax=Streptomyces sp. NPDC048362 TaxID=3365539 RepID=UPI003714E1B7
MRLSRIVRETPTVSSLYFDSTDGTPLPAARAGQYLTLRLAVGDSAPAVRSYSLSSAPGSGYRISVKHEAHGRGSGFIHGRLHPGDLVEVASPRGTFVLEESTRPVVLVSAGIGATPVLAMLHQLAAARDARPVWWIHVARDRARHIFADEAHALLDQLPDAHEHIYYTAADAGPASGERRPTPGRPTAASLAALGLPTDADAYLCGPTAFMDDIAGHLREHGLRAERIHTEQFSSLSAVNPGVRPSSVSTQISTSSAAMVSAAGSCAPRATASAVTAAAEALWTASVVSDRQGDQVTAGARLEAALGLLQGRDGLAL